MCNTHQSEFHALHTCPLFMCNMHHPLFMWNMHQCEFRARRTNLNSVQIHTHPLFMCQMYPPFFHEKYVSIQFHAIHIDIAFMCTLVSFHVQCTQVLIHMQCTSILYSWAIHHMHNLSNMHIHSRVIRTIFTFCGDKPNLMSIQKKKHV